MDPQETMSIVVEISREMSGLKRYRKRSILLEEIKCLRNIQSLIMIDDGLFDQIESFSRGNSFYVHGSPYVEELVCLKCVKDFSFKVAARAGLSEFALEFLRQQFSNIKSHDLLCPRTSLKKITLDNASSERQAN
jgi:hypothetical protein